MNALLRSRRPSDDDLIDFWVVKTAVPESDLIMIDEETARALIKRHGEAVQRTMVRPFLVTFNDLYGDEQNLRMDTVIQVYHSSPEGRALDDRQSDLLQSEKPSKPFDT